MNVFSNALLVIKKVEGLVAFMAKVDGIVTKKFSQNSLKTCDCFLASLNPKWRFSKKDEMCY